MSRAFCHYLMARLCCYELKSHEKLPKKKKKEIGMTMSSGDCVHSFPTSRELFLRSHLETSLWFILSNLSTRLQFLLTNLDTKARIFVNMFARDGADCRVCRPETWWRNAFARSPETRVRWSCTDVNLLRQASGYDWKYWSPPQNLSPAKYTGLGLSVWWITLIDRHRLLSIYLILQTYFWINKEK